MKKKYWTSCMDVVAIRRNIKQHDRVCEEMDPEYGRQIYSKKDAENSARSLLGDLGVEGFVLIMLDCGNRVIGAARLGTGVSNQCSAYPKQVFAAAILSGATSIIIAHNHPGGSKAASESDWDIANRIAKIGALIDIKLLDSLILSDDQIISMRENSRWTNN